jgi:hypothetical protein
VHCLAEDIAQHKPEQNVRIVELVWGYCHEIAHLFISYLNHVTNNRPARLDSPNTTENRALGYPDGRESGRTLEMLLFHGVYQRGWDNSGRHHRYTVRLSCALEISIALSLANTSSLSTSK